MGWKLYNSFGNEKEKNNKKSFNYKKNNINIELIGNQVPFEIKSDPEFIKVGYKCGFGDLGLGSGENLSRDDILRKQQFKNFKNYNLIFF